ncbi:carbon storage regulator [[Clostridium] hylemonae]|uniref:Translational regulator CsrA n=1 Tax=[Clostridium] hylemonae DSM 15053 TaxID=553973 RepID=C0C1K9_9FIRM|nr:carbon storage regulator [[Clostridium] hylemonae]EEG74023.1 carbon storage regulator [[Clostridium] hylemonae DSM 15053]QEK19412.1 Carbon storage regulator [[Clostridium] hylemonae DSM 15053]BDF06364.1 carbon storage regulator [[Clostridium] hylemonae]
MLVLQRKKGESLLLGDDIQISVVDIGADTVRLAIEAPKDVKILRKELAEAAIANQEAVADQEQIQKIKSILSSDRHSV